MVLLCKLIYIIHSFVLQYCMLVFFEVVFVWFF